MTSFRVLGPIEVWADDRRVAVGGPRQVMLLAFLLLNANRAVAGDTITDAVWGSSRAKANRLQMAVARLRRVLEPLSPSDDSVIRTVSGGYMLAIAPGQLDADTFASCVTQAGEALDGHDPDRAAALAAQGLDLWRGPAFAEVAFADFALPEIRRLDELRLAALETRAEADLQLGRHAQIISELTRALADEPSRERLAGQLMLALYRCQQQTAALEVYQRTRAHLSEQLGLEPGPALTSLQRQILEHDPALALADRAPPPAITLAAGGDEATLGRPPPKAMRRAPAPPTPILGREGVIDAVCGLLGDEHVRLVTLVGPGGVGKTRLALAVAHHMEPSHPGAVCWAELASVGQPADVEETLARALDIARPPGETTYDALRRFLSPRRLLLVIDNFEHLLDASGVVGELLAACPALTVLVTSREALDLSAEHRVVIEPLALPETPEQATVAELQTTAATRLFLAAARRHDAGFAPDPGQAPAVARLCTRLDGLPLALEIAAARVELLGIDDLAAELDVALSGARRAARDVADRHQTLDATIEWSHALLNDVQQAAFAAFAVFAGGSTLAAAEEVTAAPRDVLHALIAKSVIRRRRQADGSTRLVMLETVRQYAAARLEERSDPQAVRRRHLDVYERLAASAAGRLNTHDGAAALAVFDGEVDNLTAALRWAIGHEPASGLRLAAHLGAYWDIRADATGLGDLDAALAAAGNVGDAADRARVLLSRAHLRGARHELNMAREDTKSAIDLFEDAGDEAGLSRAYRGLAYLAGSLGEGVDVARSLGEIALQHAERSGDDRVIAMALAMMATATPRGERERLLDRAREVLTRIGDDRETARVYINAAYTALLDDRPAESMAYSHIARAAAERLGDVVQTMLAMGNIGVAHLFRGEVGPAGAAFRRQLELCLGQAFEFGADEGLAGLAAVAAAEGHLKRAATLLGASAALGYPLPIDQPVSDRLNRDYLAPARTAYGEARWHQAQQTGAALSYEAAIRTALEPTATEASLVDDRGDATSVVPLGVRSGA